MDNTVYMICGILLLLLFILYRPGRRNRVRGTGDGSSEHLPEPAVPQGECCGKHLVCEKQKLAEARLRSARYFDDEELDRFKGRRSDGYDDKEVEEFRYILYTMRQEEIREWMECLQAREVELPDQLKEEAFCMMNETL